MSISFGTLSRDGWKLKGSQLLSMASKSMTCLSTGRLTRLGFCDLDSLTVSEGKSGSRVSKVGSKEEVIEYAAKLFTDHGKEDVDVRIKESVERNGLSPRWEHGRLVAIDCKEIRDEEGRGVLSKSVRMSCSACLYGVLGY